MGITGIGHFYPRRLLYSEQVDSEIRLQNWARDSVIYIFNTFNIDYRGFYRKYPVIKSCNIKSCRQPQEWVNTSLTKTVNLHFFLFLETNYYWNRIYICFQNGKEIYEKEILWKVYREKMN